MRMKVESNGHLLLSCPSRHLESLSMWFRMRVLYSLWTCRTTRNGNWRMGEWLLIKFPRVLNSKSNWLRNHPMGNHIRCMCVNPQESLLMTSSRSGVRLWSLSAHPLLHVGTYNGTLVFSFSLYITSLHLVYLICRTHQHPFQLPLHQERQLFRDLWRKHSRVGHGEEATAVRIEWSEGALRLCNLIILVIRDWRCVRQQ